MIANVLSIAGSDPSGGAGIQADIKAISANGAFAMAAITALTAQNTHGVRGVHLIPPKFLRDQIMAVLTDIRVDAIKIGMIATPQIADVIAQILAAYDHIPVVLDPVMIAKGGAALLAEDAVASLCDNLVPRATVLTPNLPEAAALLGTSPARTRADMVSQGEALMTLGPRAVLMKGGHLQGADSPDVLVSETGIHWYDSPRVHTENTHGTGCTLSSALAAKLAQAKVLPDAVAEAKAYVSTTIAQADKLSVGSGHGPTNHFAALAPATSGDVHDFYCLSA